MVHEERDGKWVVADVRNWQNRYLPSDRQGEDVECEALVDSGAAEFALPVDIIERLRLEHVGEVRVYTADEGEHDYRVFGIAEVEVQGRRCQVRVIELPHGAEPRLGAVPLEEMDWHISPSEKRLVPNPRSPEKPLLPLAGMALSRRSRGATHVSVRIPPGLPATGPPPEQFSATGQGMFREGHVVRFSSRTGTWIGKASRSP